LILDKHRRTDDTSYDCIVPVSGGKDSIYQVHMVKNVFQLNPLCVTFRPLSRTPRGEENLQALRDIGVDHIDFAPNPEGVNNVTLRSFTEFGDCSLLDHLAIYGIIPNIALKFKIPLVIWGENPYMEYGGSKDRRNYNTLNRKFSSEHNILKGRTAEDWADEELSLLQLQSMIYPSDEALSSIGYEPLFLGYYIPWDAKVNLEVASRYGFKVRESEPIMGLYAYADLDCHNIVIHHYFKWLKFGFNRVTDHGSNEIRKGRMTREAVIDLIREKDGLKPPVEYINRFCKQIHISIDKFWEIAEKFRNKQIWKKDVNGEWYLHGWIAGDKIPDRFPYTALNEQEKLFYHRLAQK
jgi:N-acetyl sugar amidotransferase